VTVLFDTNVVLDVLLDREPFSTQAAILFSRVESGQLTGFLSAGSLTTLYYLIRKVAGGRVANRDIRKVLRLFEIVPINRQVLEGALALGFDDFEDAVICQAALSINAQGIITRDPDGFKKARVPVYSPSEFIQTLSLS
jgi:predicted nucleic acid-binding protein